MTCESGGTQTGCFYGLPLKLSRNLSWLFLTFSCLQQRSDVLQHISFTEHLFSAHCCLPSLERENKDPFSSVHPGWLCSWRNVLHLPWAGGVVLNKVCSTPQPCQLLQWSPGTRGPLPGGTPTPWCCNLGDEVGRGLHSVVIHIARSCSLAPTWQGYALFWTVFYFEIKEVLSIYWITSL